MKPLSGPSEAHRAKNGTFKQSYRSIVVTGQQSAAHPQFTPQRDPLHLNFISEDEDVTPAGAAGNNTDLRYLYQNHSRDFTGSTFSSKHRQTGLNISHSCSDLITFSQPSMAARSDIEYKRTALNRSEMIMNDNNQHVLLF